MTNLEATIRAQFGPDEQDKADALLAESHRIIEEVKAKPAPTMFCGQCWGGGCWRCSPSAEEAPQRPTSDLPHIDG